MMTGPETTPRSTTWRAVRVSGLALLSGMMLLVGCATSRKSAYERHLTTTIAEGPAADRDVAFAFELDEFRAAPLASGAAFADEF